MITVKLIMGVLKRVERIVYPSTGAITERIMPMNSNVPEEVVVVQSPTKELKPGHIVNMEYGLYAYHQNTMGL